MYVLLPLGWAWQFLSFRTLKKRYSSLHVHRTVLCITNPCSLGPNLENVSLCNFVGLVKERRVKKEKKKRGYESCAKQCYIDAEFVSF